MRKYTPKELAAIQKTCHAVHEFLYNILEAKLHAEGRRHEFRLVDWSVDLKAKMIHVVFDPLDDTGTESTSFPTEFGGLAPSQFFKQQIAQAVEEYRKTKAQGELRRKEENRQRQEKQDLSEWRRLKKKFGQ